MHENNINKIADSFLTLCFWYTTPRCTRIKLLLKIQNTYRGLKLSKIRLAYVRKDGKFKYLFELDYIKKKLFEDFGKYLLQFLIFLINILPTNTKFSASIMSLEYEQV